MFLTWSWIYNKQTVKQLSEWIKSEESFNLFWRLIEDLRTRRILEEFMLTLAALLCRERLLLYAADENAQPTVSSSIRYGRERSAYSELLPGGF